MMQIGPKTFTFMLLAMCLLGGFIGATIVGADVLTSCAHSHTWEFRSPLLKGGGASIACALTARE